ncbi:MAG TPA: toprim domain-containing protein [Ginsengibacter sp.]|nr:toprim domain-containing protein [Ginsengibacter sp.]HUN02290.1 toprim domain-containing protein [Niabella sp.]
MSSSEQIFSCTQAREIDIVEYLSGIGYQPEKIRGNDYWYLSPLRVERTASFKVNRKLNRWYDHAIGKGGDIIDFAILFHNCTVGEFLHSLRNGFSFQQQIISSPIRLEDADKLIIKEVKPLHSLTLIRYLHSRKISLHIAELFCKEVNYTWKNKNYYAIEFLNDAGGYELRNAFYKNSSTPKDITTIRNSARKIAVTEGFFDFLSLAEILRESDVEKWDYCILNSLAFFEKTIPFLEQYDAVHLFLDRDTAGQNCSKKALKISSRYRDESRMYRGYKDVNDWLVSMGKVNKYPKSEKPP